MPAFALPEGIESLPVTDWENAHQNFRHRFRPGASFKLRLPASLSANPVAQYRATTANMQWLIGHAIKQGQQLRAMGNGWSFSPVAVCDGGLVDTKSLRLVFDPGDSFISPAYRTAGRRSSDLVFVQCGNTMLRLNELLEARGRCLPASGASNGQTIAGAIATGTHGAAFRFGAIAEAVTGIHLVTGPGRHVWLERASRPVTTDAFVTWLGAEPLRDDGLFNAALLSFGAFGLVHGLMLETVPAFLLQEFMADHIPYGPALRQALSRPDLEALRRLAPLPAESPERELYHLELIVNLHRLAENDPDRGVYLKTYYRLPRPAAYRPEPFRDDRGHTYGDDTLGFIQHVLDRLGPVLNPLLVPVLVNQLFPMTFKPVQSEPRSMGETFNNTRFRGQVCSCAIAVAAADAFRLLDEIIRLNRQSPFPGGVALRYVKGGQATLGFTRFADSCVLELDGLDAPMSRAFLKSVWEAARQRGIDCTVHWGKINDFVDAADVRRMYGQERVAGWLACRARLLDAATRKVFSNDFMRQMGLG